jgi:hypothetical protein
MSNLDVNAELDRLEQEFEHVLASLGEGVAIVSAVLVQRIGLRPGAGSRWTFQFSPLTALYPLLQAEGLPGASQAIARRATLGHLCLMIHAFIEDRQFDKQIALTREEALFAKAMLLEGWDILHALPGLDESFRATAKHLMVEYWRSQRTRYEVPPRNTLPDDYMRYAGSGRAAHGALAPLALACCSSEENGIVRMVREAFDQLATALQWADDIEDWTDDLESGDENFLLDTLRLRGLDAYAIPPSPSRIEKVGKALVVRGVVAEALAQARRWVTRAVDCQEDLRCYQLADMITENFQPLDTAEERVTARIRTASA